MIYTDKANMASYYGISHRIDAAFDYIKTGDLLALPSGRNEVRGDEIFINRMSYTTAEEKDTFFEAHEQYIDIHVLLEGHERIGISDGAGMKEMKREPETDFVEYEGATEVYCNMTPGKVLLVFPGEAHKVKIKLKEQNAVEKVVVKVKLD